MGHSIAAMRPLRQAVIAAALLLFAAAANATALFQLDEASLAPARPDSERYAQVVVDIAALEHVAPGEVLTVTIPGVGRFEYRVQRRSRDDGLTLIEAVLSEGAAKRLTLGVRGANAAAYIETPAGAFVLGYANSTHWLGVAGREQAAPEAATVAILSQRAPASVAERGGTSAQPPVPDAEPVAVNIAALTDLAAGAEANLSLPRMGDVSVVYEQTLNDSETPTWVGYLKDYGKDYRVVLSFAPTGTQGRILAPSGEYLIMPGPDGDWLVDSTASGLVEPGNEGCAQGEFAAGAATAGAATATTTATPASFATAASTAVNSVVDLLVLYTQDLVERLGGPAAVTARINYLVSLTNLSYRDGNIPLQLRVVQTAPVTVPVSSSNATVLSQLRAGSAPFASVPALRSQYGADLVMVMRPFRMAEQQGVCGVGYVGGYNGTDVASYSAYGYSVVADGTDVGGSNNYCQDYTFPHELGHNMGLMHDRATVTSQGGGSGAYPYAFGYGRSGVFGTIMSYIQPRRGRFSNPLDSSCAGQPCGVPATVVATAADNAQALRLTGSKVAAFLATRVGVATRFTVTGAITVEGKPQAGVTVSSTNSQATCTPSGATGVYQCSLPAGASATLTPSLNGVVFTPATRAVAAIAANLSAYNFAGQTQRYSVTGRVTLNGAALAGVRLQPSLSSVSCANSGSTGSYTCTAPAGSSFTLTPQPTATGMTFSPARVTVATLRANLANANFAATPPSYSVTGRVTLNGAALAGVRLQPSLSGVSCANSGSTGSYTCTAPAGSSFTLTPQPTATGMTFSPARVTVTTLRANQANANFAAAPPPYSFTVRVTAGGAAVSGTSLRVSGTASCPATGSGVFRCTIPYGASATLTPVAQGWRMSPASASYSNLRAQPQDRAFYAYR